jgi:lipopolysaccharide export system ATP-binding protein
VIQVNNLFKSYNKNQVVNGVSLTIDSGEIVGLLGPNGAGKTTIFYMITGLIRPDSGTVLLNHQDITEFPMHRRSKSGVGYLPQDPSIFKSLTVEENIFILWELLNHFPKHAYEHQLNMLLEELNIAHLRHSKCVSLSGGERRRVEIMRCLATSPKYILLDEPFAGIDPISISDIQQIIMQLKAKGIGIIITDHNVRETLGVTDRAYLIHKGELAMQGRSDDIIESPVAREFYLGDDFRL